jgi:hypothetical protein
MIEINGQWRIFLLRNWRLKVDEFQNVAVPIKSIGLLNLAWNGALQKWERVIESRSMALTAICRVSSL